MKKQNSSGKADILYITIPAYNERENIEKLIDEWYPLVQGRDINGLSRLVIIDDGSTDGTLDILKSKAEKLPMLKVLTKENEGHGRTVLYGYAYALRAGADYIFQTDSDRQASADEFESFWRQRKRYDVIIGNRYMREDGIGRAFVSKTITLMIALFLQSYVKDANAPYRLMSRKALKSALEYIEDGEALPNIMLSVVFKRKGVSLLYRDIRFKKRLAGEQSVNLIEIFKGGMYAVGHFVRLNERLN